MRVRINGELRELEGATVEAVLIALSLPLDRVAVEHNGAIIKRSARNVTPVNDGDILEIVTLVGGG
jgi:sulfur carrier protein